MYLKVVTLGKDPALSLVGQLARQEYKLPWAPAVSVSAAIICVKVTFPVQGFDM